MNLFGKLLFTVFLIQTFSVSSFGNLVVNFSGHGLVRSEHTVVSSTDATLNPKVYISFVLQNNSTETATGISFVTPTLSIVNATSPWGCSSTLFTGSTRLQAAWFTGGTLQSANVPLTNAPTNLPIIITAQEQVNGVWTEGITVPPVPTTSPQIPNTLYHIYLAGSLQWTCQRCVPGTITLSGSMAFASNTTQTAGLRTWNTTQTLTGYVEKMLNFPITMSTLKY